MEWYLKLSIGNAFRVSDGIIIISKFTKDRIIDKFHFDESKLIIAYCALSTVFLAYAELQKKDKMTLETIKNKVCQKYQLPKHYFLCLTKLEPRKNISFLIDVYMELLLQEEVNKPLVLAGRKGWKMEHFLE